MAVAEQLDCNPPYLHPAYRITVRRAPEKQLISLPRHWFHDAAGPAYGRIKVGPDDNNLLIQHAPGRPIGQRIVLAGRVLDSDGRGVPGALIEIWQTNAAGRYVDVTDPDLMPLDPNFTGAGRTLTDNDGRYSFRSVKPAAYPGERGGLFRPAHIHVSVFGTSGADRLITQCYFEGDPLIPRDPILGAVVDPRGRERLIARFNDADTELGGIDSALAYDWDIVLRGHRATPFER